MDLRRTKRRSVSTASQFSLQSTSVSLSCSVSFFGFFSFHHLRKPAMLVKKKSTTNGEAMSPSASPKHRPPLKPARNAPAAKQTRHKQVNPNAEVVYNHRARFSRFKRRIHAQRRWVLESHTAQSVAAAAGHQEREVISAEGDSSVLAETEEQWDSQPADTLAPRRVAAAVSSSSAAVQRAVAGMDALFGQLDAAVKLRRLGRVAFLRRSLRARQQHLRRSLLSTAHSASSTAITTASSIREVPADSYPSPYRNFHPPSTWLGVGRHPSSEWVDQRSGRYPKTCTPAQIQFVMRRCADDDSAARGVTAAQQEWLRCLPTLPVDPKKTAERTEAAASPPPTLTRAQRQLKASLFVATYCANLLTDTLDDVAFTLLQGLYEEQRGLKQRQPLQFKARQRYVVGFQEVLKCLKAGRVRLVLLAADVEAVDAPEAALHDTAGSSAAAAAVAGAAPARAKPTRRKAFQSLHEAVAQVQQLCGSAASDAAGGLRAARAPPLCITCMSRQRLSYALYAKGSKVGCVGVMQAEKNRDALKAVMACGRLLTQMYAGRESESVSAEKSSA